MKSTVTKSILLLIVFVGAVLLQMKIATAKEANVLTNKEQSIITIAGYTASGDIESLKTALPAGLEAGLTINEINEVLVQMYAYAGFPRSLNGINAFVEVLNNRKRQGIDDIQGEAATPLPNDINLQTKGNATRNTLVGKDLTMNQAPYAQAAPVIDKYLKEHLFGAIFARDTLSYKQREFATIGALAAMHGTSAQLSSHLQVSLNVGITKEQLHSFTSLVSNTFGADQGQIAEQALKKVLHSN